MLLREVTVSTHLCPRCGGKLVGDNNKLFCKEHGAFFLYGPHLLVRAPQHTAARAGSDLPMPWDTKPRRM